MSLSENLKDQFAKMVNADNPKENTDNTVYGTVKVYSDGTKAVVLDGSNIATPFETVTDAEDGDRVTVTIRNHKAVVTGNLSSPAARTDAVKTNSEKIGEFNTVLSNKVGTDELDAQVGRINTLESDNATIKQKLAASEGEFKEIKTKQLEVEEKVTAAEAEIKTIKSDKIDATVVESEYTKTKVFDALAGTVGTLNGDFSNFKNTTTEKLDAHKADIDELNTKKLNSEDADLKFANINFTNIGKAAMEYFYAQSGLIKNVVVGDQTITGELIGVTIKGDLIEGNTVVADKLVIKGEDGLYYKLNTDGITTEIEQTDYNSINGQVIRAKSVTASKIDVKDLVAFDATIAGFKIDDNAIHSIGKESATSGVRGIYLGKDGQMAVGDSNHYIKYYKDTDGSFKLAISAESMEFSSGTSVKDAIDNINNKVDNIKSIKNTAVTYQVGDSNTKAPTGTWSPNIPSVPVGKYLWTRTVFTYSDDTISTSYGISSMGAKGETGATGLQGIQGEKGDQGIQGPKGDNGRNSYFHIKYSSVANPTSSNQMTETPSTYIGTYTDDIETDSTDPKKYSWTKIKGDTGAKGETGATGPQGPQGADGKGVKSTAITYQASSNGTTAPTGTWNTTVPGVSAGQYLWTRTIITYTDNTTSTLYSVSRNGTNGTNGQNGKSIGSVINYYLATNANSGVNASTTGWTTTVQSVSSSKKYLWNYEIVKYTDGTTASTTAPCIIGSYGDKGATGATGPQGPQGAAGAAGATGNGIKSIVEHYAVSASNTSTPTSWSNTVPTMTVTNRYLWNYETITYTNNSTVDTTKRVIGVYGNTGAKGDKGATGATGPQGPQGAAGAAGATGNGIKSIVEHYAVSASNTSTPTSWSNTVPTMTVTNRYLWNYETITYTNNSTVDTTKRVIGVYGNTGAKGDKGATGATGPAGKGIKSTSVTYQAGASGTTAPTGAWSSTPPTTTEAASYLWTRTVITYTDNTTSTSYSVGSTPAGILSTVNSNITKTKEEIAQSVSKTYQTKDAMGNYYTTKQVDSAINTRCGQVELKVDGKLADLKSNANATLKLCVKEDETGRLKSMIEAIADTINITAKGGLNLTGNRFSVTSTNLTITKDGSMTCKNLSVTGGNIDILADDYQTGKISTHANWYTSSLSPFGLTATGRFNNATYSNSGIEFAKNGSSESVVVIGCSSEVDHISIYANSAKITSQLTIPIGYNKLNQRATTSANDTQAFSYAWTINGTGLFILNAGLWTDTTDDYGTTNCAIYVNGACVTANTHRYGESSNSVELDAGATFVYWFRNANNQKVLLLAGSTKTGNKTLTYTVQGLFGLAVT